VASAAVRHGPTDKYTDEAAREFRAWRALARADTRAAKRLDPGEVMAYAADMVHCEADPDDLAAITRERPSTLLLRARFMASLSPRCGGRRARLDLTEHTVVWASQHHSDLLRASAITRTGDR
jgi:hypothetical protein